MPAEIMAGRAYVERDTHQTPARSSRFAIKSASDVVSFIARRLEQPSRLPHTKDGPTTPISIQAIIAMTGRSQRTWWRRVESGVVRKLKPDARGRARIALEDVIQRIDCPLSVDDKRLLAQADDGDAEAQADVGELFLACGMPDAGRYWLELAAEQGYANAMQCLARCYLSGDGVPKDEDMAIRWLADAAARGHVIARGQMRALREGATQKKVISGVA